jgi:ADP-ribose pyrophosphatase YjhB (NUDIX family)
MDPRTVLTEFFAGGDRAFLPHLAVDCAILGFHAGELKVLLLRWRGATAWSLPGGFVRKDEPLDRAAERVLRERTGLERIYLQQFHAFGGTDRREDALRPALRALGVEAPRDHWLLSRVVSIGYVALVDFAGAAPSPDSFSEECRWWDLHDRPALLFDHDAIVARALATVRAALDGAPIGNGTAHSPIAASLLPDKFTMPELQRLYETVLGRPLDRRNFQKWVLDRGLVVRLEERKVGGAHRAPFLYRFAERR